VFERFTDRARRSLVLAQEEARLLQHNFIGTEHLLLGLLAEAEGVAALALSELGVTLVDARQKVKQTLGATEAPMGSPPFTSRAKKVLELSLREALQLHHNYIGTEHILLGLVRDGSGVGAHVLEGLGATHEKVRTQVMSHLTPPGWTAASPRPVPEERYRRFIRSLPGPATTRAVTGGAMRVLSVEIYDSAVAVSVLVSHELVASVEESEEVRPRHWSRGEDARNPILSDDLGTSYEPGNGVFGGDISEFHVRRVYEPAPPSGARRLTVKYGAVEGIEIELPAEEAVVDDR